VDVNDPGVMAIVAAPAVAQPNLLLDPEVIVVGLAVKELMIGLIVEITATVTVDVAEPAALVAVSV